jgi:hypothetical protein
MSYLLGPRLHFAGRFKANVSTVNNDPTHFDNANFQPGFQQPGDDGGWWNPGGSGVWELLHCTITSGVFADGKVVNTAAEDPVVGFTVADGESPRAKLVDLDSEQQLVSQIWGLQVVVSQVGGANPVFSGAFEIAAFTDLWSRSSAGNGGGDTSMGACWQSVLSGVTWGDVGNSPLLQKLKEATAAGLLSIKFNVDGYNMESTSPNFVTGRIVGTIGAVSANEPHQFVRGRHCMPLNGAPVTVNFFPAVVDEARGKLIADLGNALPTTTIGGPIDPSKPLELGMFPPNRRFVSLGRVNIGGNGWYEKTAGVCEFPPDRKLTSTELDNLKKTPIALGVGSGNNVTVLAREGLDGLHVRADAFVYRMSPGDNATATLYATRFGKPLPNVSLSAFFNSRRLQGGDGNLAVATPASALTFPTNLTTDQNGGASLALAAHNPGNPRQYIDGQVYGVGYGLPQSAQGAGGYSNPWNFISVLVWSAFQPTPSLTWWDDIHPILQQYANLYPFMKFIKLGDYNDVVANTEMLRQVFNLPQGDAHYMPVTRDLSPAKRQAILNWLNTTGNNGQPNLGTPPPVAVAALAEAAPVAEAIDASGGGKSAALRRLTPRPLVVYRG